MLRFRAVTESGAVYSRGFASHSGGILYESNTGVRDYFHRPIMRVVGPDIEGKIQTSRDFWDTIRGQEDVALPEIGSRLFISTLRGDWRLSTPIVSIVTLGEVE